MLNAIKLRNDGRKNDELRDIKIIWLNDNKLYIEKTIYNHGDQLNYISQDHNSIFFKHGLNTVLIRIIYDCQLEQIIPFYSNKKIRNNKNMILSNDLNDSLIELLCKIIKNRITNNLNCVFHVNVLQYDNNENILGMCILNGIFTLMGILGIGLYDWASGCSLLYLNGFNIYNYTDESTENDNFLIDPTLKEQTSSFPCISLHSNYNKKTINYLSLTGPIHYKQFRKLINKGLECSDKMSNILVEYVKSIVKK